MVGKKKRRRKSSLLLGSHQKCWLWGRHAVCEMLRAGRWQPVEVILDPAGLAPQLYDEVQSIVAARGIVTMEMEGAELTRLCGSSEHQGLMAKMPPYPYADAQQLLDELREDSALLVLCGIQDPFNFGSMLRSADLFGIDAVIVPASGQASVSSHVARSSVGAVNYLKIVETDELADFCTKLRERGLTLVAATEKGKQSPAQTNLQRGVAILIGNEGQGIDSALLNLCDESISIPQQGHVGSLNAAVATGILCYELRRQRADGS